MIFAEEEQLLFALMKSIKFALICNSQIYLIGRSMIYWAVLQFSSKKLKILILLVLPVAV